MAVPRRQPFRVRLRFALHGLAHALRTEASLRFQAAAAALALLALLALRPAAVWWALVLLASAAVLSAELLNTAIEQLADELHPADSPGIRIVKDCAAAGVLIAALGAVATGVALLVHLLAHGS
ncbi:MAG TPA: diacylglycerol kinase [Steroidobacteraceae bacterium]|nr:diacylglycerol kinase [Steroidobacteraceae bacterium]